MWHYLFSKLDRVERCRSYVLNYLNSLINLNVVFLILYGMVRSENVFSKLHRFACIAILLLFSSFYCVTINFLVNAITYKAYDTACDTNFVLKQRRKYIVRVYLLGK